MTIMMKINIGKTDIIIKRVLSGTLFSYLLRRIMKILKLSTLN